MYEAIILDTETTNIDSPEVIELAWRSYHFDGAPFTGGQEWFMPTGEISIGAVATHHILREDLAGNHPSSLAPEKVPSASFWIGHNVDFDWRALGQPPFPHRICTMAMCRSIWPKVEKHTLVAMMYFLEGMTPATREAVAKAHGAVVDIALCARILERIVNLEGIKSAKDLWGFSEECRVPKIMGFGKFKGEPVSAVDRGWANWYQRQAETDPYLIEALRRARKL